MSEDKATTAKSITAAEFLENKDRCTAAAIELAGQKTISAKLHSDLRTRFGDTLAGLIVESASLQTKARRKFGDIPASEHAVWWATRRSLQQATPWQVAKLKAGWFGQADVLDLCCAIGGDSIALAARGGAMTAVDRDPVLVAMAGANLATSLPKAVWQTQCQDVVGFQIPKGTAVHIDPDRRSDDKHRGTRAESFSPSWDEVVPIIDQSDSAIVKLAPATELDWQPSDRPSHRCWIALQGTVREQALLVGDSVKMAGLVDQQKSAFRMAADGSWHRFAPKNAIDNQVAANDHPGTWLIDPVSSVRAAGLTESFAATHSLGTLGGLSGFLTSSDDDLPDEVSAMATTGRIVWTGSANDRKLRRELRSHGWFPETVKCRGADRDPAEVFRRYRDCGDVPVTLWLGRIGKKVYAAISLVSG
ncbi:hypothetical protein LF1_41990 [Rubripirellula obstinata]|uniref:THUMP-like domain-containing protein n=1 Tax=Rubripirellula obstinata TaxID=406547 RepID=A0A5B1CQX4_9BACT|nr:class I SAM-dependent methyltransferase [Rubripirellula obstinata]KAA1261644.1 hypothetical protein LF1_41990 [Rubripirellula obstinata]